MTSVIVRTNKGFKKATLIKENLKRAVVQLEDGKYITRKKSDISLTEKPQQGDQNG